MKRTYPDKIAIALCHRCNLHCAYCCFFHRGGGNGREELGLTEWKEVFRRCNGKVFRVSLNGGEALLHPDFSGIVSAIVANRMRFDLLSNGILLDEAACRLLTASGRCDGVKLSLDGVEEVHDAARGCGSWQAAMAALTRLKRVQLPYLLCATVHRGNVRHLPETIAFLLQQARPEQIVFSAAVNREDSGELALTPEEMTEVLRCLLPYYRNFMPKGVAGAMREMLRVQERFQSHAPLAPESRCCGGLQTALGIGSDGVVVPCLELPALRLGHILRDSLEELWRRADECRTGATQSRMKACGGCQYQEFCRGGCVLAGERENEATPCLHTFGCVFESMQRGTGVCD